MASSSLQDFVKEQKKNKSGYSFSKLQSGFDDLKSKITASNGVSTSGYLPLIFGGKSSDSESTFSASDPFSTASKDQKNGQNSTGAGGGWLSNDCCGLSRTQRFIGFFACIFAGMFCFGVACMYIPVLIFKARKFAALYTLGSLFFISSFALLWGPASYLKHLFSQPRLPVTLVYFFTLSATIYTSLFLMSTVLTIICASAQVCALIWFLLSYIPGGERGLKFMTSICGRFVKKTASSGGSNVLPV